MPELTATLLRPDGTESLGSVGPSPWEEDKMVTKFLYGNYQSARNFIRFSLSKYAAKGPWIIRHKDTEKYMGVYYSGRWSNNGEDLGKMEEAVSLFLANQAQGSSPEHLARLRSVVVRARS